MEKFQILRRTAAKTLRFLELEVLDFCDHRGRVRNWECVTRRNCAGAVLIVATVAPGDDLVLIRQFRPPAGRFLIEFPAGLLDHPDEDPAEAARRELYEETGYTGTVELIGPPVYSSPGLTGETLIPVRMKIDGAAYPVPPAPHPEDSESIECFRVPRRELKNFLAAARDRGDGIDSKLLALLDFQFPA